MFFRHHSEKIRRTSAIRWFLKGGHYFLEVAFVRAPEKDTGRVFALPHVAAMGASLLAVASSFILQLESFIRI